ncbi:MAG: hypothetical protein ACJA0Z_004670 [Halioglobus sp.]
MLFFLTHAASMQTASFFDDNELFTKDKHESLYYLRSKKQFYRAAIDSNISLRLIPRANVKSLS